MKRVFAIIAIALLLLVIPVEANASARVLAISPRLEFSGTTASCGVVISANSGEDITVVLKLWHGSTCLKGWTEYGESYLQFSDTCPVVSGQTYRLTADVTINGVAEDQVAISKTCP